MSRIGKAPITIPSGVTVTVEGTNVKVKGPKGELTQEIDPAITVVQEDGVLTFARPSDEKEHRSKHGLYRALVANMVTGVTEGYRVDMELVGVGYRASAAGQELTLALGYSHPIVMMLPNEIKLESETKKGSNPTITLMSHDRQLIGMVAAKIRSFRKPEPYKGKGIRFVGEVIRRKAGKTASK